LTHAPQLSVVVPGFQRAGQRWSLAAGSRGRPARPRGIRSVFVDDNSKDGTLAALRALKAEVPELRVLHHVKQSGQSTAIRTGVRHARAPWVATLDGDGQNDPADIPKLLAARDAATPQIRLFAGWRVNRQDSGSKRWASKWANAIRTACCATTRPTPAAASSCSSATPSSTCPTSTTCIATCPR
jgi:dolichol-phosphate mannosyltransferase